MAKKKRRTASKSRRGAKRTSKVASGGKYLGHYGWMPDVPDHRDLVYAAARITTLPPSVDLRPGCPPVYDQGQLGSCTANAIAAAIQFEQIRQKEPKPFAPSRGGRWAGRSRRKWLGSNSSKPATSHDTSRANCLTCSSHSRVSSSTRVSFASRQMVAVT